MVLQARARGSSFPVQLYDISPTGCRIECATNRLTHRDRIVFHFAEEVQLAGNVVWRRKGAAGIVFEKPLPEAIARHLRPRA